jgi:drug/metabolite transporter (DMT)-like permease
MEAFMKEKNTGVIFILCSSLFFALMAASVKSVPHIPLAEKVFFRNFIGLIAVGIPMMRRRISFKPNNKKLVLLRSVFGLSGVALYYTSLGLLNLSDAVIINKLSPFFVIVLSVIFLKEDIKKHQFAALALALIGAALVVKPGFNFEILPALIGLTGAIFAGGAYTTIRKLSETDHPQLIVFYFCLFSTLVTIPFMAAGQFVVPSSKDLVFLVSIGISALIAQLLMTNAYRHAPASQLSIYTYANVVFSTILGFIVWHEVPDSLSLAGAILIIAGSGINFYYNQKRISS